jgi:hypothetical protein
MAILLLLGLAIPIDVDDDDEEMADLSYSSLSSWNTLLRTS